MYVGIADTIGAQGAKRTCAPVGLLVLGSDSLWLRHGVPKPSRNPSFDILQGDYVAELDRWQVQESEGLDAVDRSQG